MLTILVFEIKEGKNKIIINNNLSLLSGGKTSGVLGTIFLGGGGSELSTNMRPYNVTLDKRGPKARAERRRCEVFLWGYGGMPPGKFLNLESLQWSPGLWGTVSWTLGEDLTEI